MRRQTRLLSFLVISCLLFAPLLQAQDNPLNDPDLKEMLKDAEEMQKEAKELQKQNPTSPDTKKKLADMLNALSLEERRQARLDRIPWLWFNQMTEDEKAAFIEATMPTGFKQMLAAFEQLPEEKRHRTIDDTLRRLREAQDKTQTGTGSGQGRAGGTNRPPPLSPELEAKVRSIGLQTFYSQSSAQTKAELAPVMEELQRVMESGRPFRGR